MKRNINLQQLSKEHHDGLLLGWKIRQGLKYLADPQIVAEYIAFFSEAALFPHFQEEEEQVLPYLPDNDRLKQQTLSDHKQIEALIRQLASVKITEPASFLNIAGRIDGHIRFEERELFPYLEQQLNDDQLEEIGKSLQSNHQPFVDTFPVEFWKKPVKQEGE